MSTVGRNERCPCGSGKKFKKCCALKSGRTSFGGWAVASAIGVMLLVGAVIVLSSLRNLDSEPTGPRRVWSEEHGHWH